jgi:SWI/SNF-related matrix-associated actin-dependent regulator 1 of chromatin subfamily A
MINLNDIKSRSVKPLLESYVGINPYLIKLAQQIKNSKNLNLTENQINYVLNNHDKEPTFINRVLKISSYLGEEFQKTHHLNFKPEKILVEFILAETDKTYHIYGKLTQKQKNSEMYWVPKTQLLDDPYFEPITIDVDFTKYNDVLSKYGKKLFNHQEEGVKFLLSRRGCILADDMGLGKSITSIVAALESGAKKILIVTTASAKINWEREIKVFDNQTAIVEGKNWKESKFTIINYDILKNFHTLVDKKAKKKSNIEEIVLKRELVNANFDLIIIDEAHSIKDKDSNRGKIMEELSNTLSDVRVWLLTGTPISNRPMDFFNLLKIIKSKLSENWLFFARRYCDAKKMFTTLKNGTKKQILNTNGASNLEELADKTRNIILRRLKKDVLDMPDKMVIPMYYRMSYAEQTEYNELWDEYVIKRTSLGKSTNVTQKDLIELILLRQFIANITIPYTIEMVENAIEMGKKIIIFTTFTEELEIIKEHFGKKAVAHNGKMSAKEKQKSIDEFQGNEKIKVFVGNIQSAGVAITLTEASVVIFNSFSWVPGINEQAEDRCVFSGQLIMTKEGYKKIEDIKYGDLVYTHLGNFKPVTGIYTHLERKKLKVDINAFGYNENLSVTEDHELFVYNTETRSFEWKKAIDLDIKKHCLTLKSKEQPFKRKEFLDVINYVDENFENNFLVSQKNGRLLKLKDKVELKKEDGYIIYPIKSLHISKPQRGKERVYDLSVEDDHSFVVGNYNVHNCYRIGQKNDVTVYYQLFEDTISNRMWETLSRKKQIISTIIGDKSPISDDEINFILANSIE